MSELEEQYNSFKQTCIDFLNNVAEKQGIQDLVLVEESIDDILATDFTSFRIEMVLALLKNKRS